MVRMERPGHEEHPNDNASIAEGHRLASAVLDSLLGVFFIGLYLFKHFIL